jgi:hypothetical protein
MTALLALTRSSQSPCDVARVAGDVGVGIGGAWAVTYATKIAEDIES